MFHSEYFGVSIWRNMAPGYALRWMAGRFAADTLAGIRALIREEARGAAR